MTEAEPDLTAPLVEPPLFALPEYERAGRSVFFASTNALMRSQNELLAQVSVETVETVGPSQLSVASGELLESSPMGVEANVIFSTSALLDFDIEELVAVMDATAADGLASMMPQFFERLAEVCDASGQTVSAEGRPLSHELLLEAIEAVEIPFDDQGQPILPTLIMGRAMAKKVANLPPRSPEQDRRWQEMLDSKREEYLANRRTRRLSTDAD